MGEEASSNLRLPKRKVQIVNIGRERKGKGKERGGRGDAKTRAVSLWGGRCFSPSKGKEEEEGKVRLFGSEEKRREVSSI